jgi:chemotaxis protein methyltransferase CheR
MCLADLSVPLRGWQFQLLGTDISESSLKLAREAVYRKRTMQELEPTKIKRYFAEEAPDQYRLRPAVSQMARFKSHNLMQPLAEPPFDCIYFDRESKTKVIENLVPSLVPGGYLVVGPSEGVYDMLGMLRKRGTFLYQKP